MDTQALHRAWLQWMIRKLASIPQIDVLVRAEDVGNEESVGVWAIPKDRGFNKPASNRLKALF